MELPAIRELIQSKLPTLKQRLLAEQDRLDIKHGTGGIDKLTVVLNNTNPFVFRIRIKFNKAGVFVHKGVGRGGAANRTPKPWFNPIVETFISELSETLLDEFVTIAYNNLNIK